MEFKKNDLLTVTIEDMGHDGEGIGKCDGYTVFVKDAVIGDTVRVKLMKTRIWPSDGDPYPIPGPDGGTLSFRPSLRGMPDPGPFL